MQLLEAYTQHTLEHWKDNYDVEALNYIESKNHPNFWVEHNQVCWSNSEQDFQTMLLIKSIIDLDLDDESFAQFIPLIEQRLLSTELFGCLNDDTIEVSFLHTGTNPFVHTINVLRQLKTDGLSADLVRAARWSAIWHDVGKIFGATEETGGKHHSVISKLISRQFFYQNCPEVDSALIEDLLKAIFFHHAPEGWGGPKKWLTDRQVWKHIKSPQTALILHVLVAADVSSVGDKGLFRNNLNRMFERLAPYAHLVLSDLGLLRSVLTDPHPSSNGADRQ